MDLLNGKKWKKIDQKWTKIKTIIGQKWSNKGKIDVNINVDLNVDLNGLKIDLKQTKKNQKRIKNNVNMHLK